MDEPKNLNILTFVIGKYHHSVVNQIEDNLKDATEASRYGEPKVDIIGP